MNNKPNWEYAVLLLGVVFGCNFALHKITNSKAQLCVAIFLLCAGFLLLYATFKKIDYEIRQDVETYDVKPFSVKQSKGNLY